MSDIEWESFIKEIIEQNGKINLKKECKKRGVGLNTLYRKVMNLESSNKELYDEFTHLYPYKPRDIKGIDFEQLMRESILSGISQKELEEKYDIPKRTIQRKFAIIKKENERLYEIYQMYVRLKVGEALPYSILDEVAANYVQQNKVTEAEKLKLRKNEFMERLRNINDTK